ncbi:MAG: SUMF1/EgtB/PvdO family nonheme iron enzyme [Spirochaetota bacterium]
MRYLLLLLLFTTSCVHKSFVSVPLGSGKTLVFAEFQKSKSPWPYGFRGEVAAGEPFALSLTEVPYSLWFTVRLWGEKEAGYQFHSPGAEGSSGRAGAAPEYQAPMSKVPGRMSSQQPVSQVSWGDVVVWCNALSEYLNQYTSGEQRQPVYRVAGGEEILRSAERANRGELYRDPAANGFRLPAEQEWESAGRWLNGRRWLAGDWVAGSTGTYSSRRASNQVAWYVENSGGKSQPVAGRRPTVMGLYDMGGNLAEWVEDPFSGGAAPLPFRTIKGGAYLSPTRELQVAGRFPALPQQVHQSIGFRLAFGVGNESG